jgi:hypothetical protein
MKVLFLLLFSFNVYAQDDSCVAIENSPVQFGLSKLLDWFGAVDNQVEKAPCKTKTPLSEAEMLKFIASKTKGSAADTVHGVKLKNESPALIKAFKEFTTAKDSFGIYDLLPNQKQIRSEYKIGQECDKVLCAMEKIWGKDSIKLLYIKLKHGFNTSELAFENSDRFTSSELDDVIMGLEDLPQSLIPLAVPNQRLTHFKRGYTLKQYSGSTVANAVVMIFDPWDKKSHLSKQYTIFHEMSHNVSTRLNDMDESPEWLKLSGWVKKGDDWSAAPTACSVSTYGETNPWEDFAETLSAFRYNGSQLKVKCPEKFEFVKNKVFRGMDYTEVKNCSTVPIEKVELAQKEIVNEIMSTIGTTTFDEKDLKESCEKGFSTYPVDEKELGICSLKLHSTKALNGNNPKIAEALAKAGIPDTAGNRDLVLNGITDSFTEEMMNQVSQNSINVKDQIDLVVLKSMNEANPAGFSNKNIKADDYRWRTSLKQCGAGFFTGKNEDVKQCQLKALINQDREFQKYNLGLFPEYKIPSIFFNDAKGFTEKREEILLAHISKQPLGDEAIQIEKKRFVEDMKYHITTVQVKLYKMPDWKKMSPQDFCKEAYGGGTSWTEQYGATPGQPIPKLYEGCVREQSTKSKRFEFKEEQWLKIVTE